MNGIDERMGKLLAALMTDDVTLQAAAAHAVNTYYKSSGVHPSDLVVLSADFTTTWRETFARLKRAEQENDFLRRHVPPQLIKQAAIAGEIEYRWPELLVMAETRFVNDDGQLLHHWRKRAADVCGVSSDTVRQWETGIARIPESAFEAIRAIPVVANPPAVHQPRRRGSARDGFRWTKESYRHALDMLQAKKGLPAVYREFPEAGEGAINRAFGLDAPDENLLGTIPVQDDGPMSFLELWKIGHALYGQTWKRELTFRFRLSRNAIQWDFPSFLTPKQRQELRCEWHIEGGRKMQLEPQAQRVLDEVRKAGPNGTTTKELEKSIPGCHRRTRTLVLARLIFKTTGKVWVASEFGDHHPGSWSASNNIVQRAVTRGSIEPPRIPSFDSTTGE